MLLPQRYVFSSKSQPFNAKADFFLCCCCYHKGTYFQANHNLKLTLMFLKVVVVATTKVRIFKQITTDTKEGKDGWQLLLLPQRYVFSSKSQPRADIRQFLNRCCCYHKGTYFQANHNPDDFVSAHMSVVVATTKVRIFKQITTRRLLIAYILSCCCYHKGTYFQANHNYGIYSY